MKSRLKHAESLNRTALRRSVPRNSSNTVAATDSRWQLRIKPTRSRSFRPDFAHEIAKLLLEHAGTFLGHVDAVKSAMALGMPLHDIEEYLDWTKSVDNRVQ